MSARPREHVHGTEPRDRPLLHFGIGAVDDGVQRDISFLTLKVPVLTLLFLLFPFALASRQYPGVVGRSCHDDHVPEYDQARLLVPARAPDPHFSLVKVPTMPSGPEADHEQNLK